MFIFVPVGNEATNKKLRDMTTVIGTDSVTGQMYETLTFENKMQITMFSSDLHRVNFICSYYGYDIENWNEFNKALDIYNKDQAKKTTYNKN